MPDEPVEAPETPAEGDPAPTPARARRGRPAAREGAQEAAGVLPAGGDADGPADGHPSIQALMAEASAAVGAVGKDANNEQQGFRYRSFAAVTAAVQPVLARLGIAVVPRVLHRDVVLLPVGNQGKQWRLVTLTMRYRFVGPGGDHVDVVTIGEGFDPSDKAANKAMTNAMKYALTQALVIAESEVDESDAETHADAHGGIGRPPPPDPLAAYAERHGYEAAASLQAIVAAINAGGAEARRAFRAEFGMPYDLAPSRLPDAMAWVEDREAAAEPADEGDALAAEGDGSRAEAPDDGRS